MRTLNEFTCEHPYLICVDSDGCAIDSMEIKHRSCFGPLIAEEWGIIENRDSFLARWNEINLYSGTRGINRFKGLAFILKEYEIEGYKELDDWTSCTRELSNAALERESSPVLRKALKWSVKVNEAIEKLPVAAPYEGVKYALEAVCGWADIAVISSANYDAIYKEWNDSGLLDSVSVFLSQSDGTKAYCIDRLLEQGYEKDKAVMIGDSPGDLAAASENGILFYPILPLDEVKSWELFRNNICTQFYAGQHCNEWDMRMAAYRKQLDI